MDKNEGVRRIAVVLRAIGWISVGGAVLVVAAAAVLGRWSSVGEGIPLLFMLGGLFLAGAYVLNGFVGGTDKSS